MQRRKGRDAQWGSAGWPKLVGAQEARWTELGRGCEEPQQMGTTLDVHSRRGDKRRIAASMVGWVKTEDTLILYDKKKDHASVLKLTVINLPSLSRIRLEKIVLACDNTETEPLNVVG